MEKTIDLNQRKAKCMDCGKEVESDFDLAFFKYSPLCKKDEFYCGCRGWD